MMSNENEQINLHLVQYLKKILIEWELNSEQLARISHVPVDVMKTYLDLPVSSLDELPSIPSGLETAMPLVSVYKNLKRLLPEGEKLNEWLVSPHDLFEGNKPIEVMAMSPNHLSWVSYTLESQAQEKGFFG